MATISDIFNAKTLAKNLRVTCEKLKDVIDSRSQHMLYTLSNKILSTEKGNICWNLGINYDQPLTFKPSTKHFGLQPEIFCNIIADKSNEWFLNKYELVIRIWSNNMKLNCPEKITSEEFNKKIIKNDNKRVIFRCHFEWAKNIENEPVFHMQFGGQQRDGNNKEYFFLPDNFCVPRFLYPPLDLFLAIELILDNFYPEIYKRIGEEDGKWFDIIKKSELMFFKNYFSRCKEIVCERDTIFRKMRS